MKNLVFTLLIFLGVQGYAQQTNSEAYIKKESIGGKLDFTKRIEEKFRDTPTVRFGNETFSKKDYAILLWATNVRNLGIESFDIAEKLWKEINNRNLSDTEKKALKTGFEAKF